MYNFTECTMLQDTTYVGCNRIPKIINYHGNHPEGS